MHAEDWKNIKAVLSETINLATAERQLYLDRSDLTAEVRSEVESLLGLRREAEDFMSLSIGEFSRDFFEELTRPASSLVNQRIGIYEIISELDFGGMGAVYLATRVDGKFEQRVAIKLLRREFNTEKLRRTFEREKKILAALAHPNIATLLDAGTTEDGIPYLVMEYVKGEPIDQFCQSRKLSLNARLKLFNKVCEAVAFAHRNLIVHRDLKPSNILVNEDGEPKLLDFGISKLLDAEAEDAGIATHIGALTPQYASPEQLREEPVTTATDVYSLGVVLFKILTENLPYRVGENSNGNLHREIANAAPALPSEVALAPLTRDQLKGDLDNIVLKSLRKEPERRYQTVQQFSADIWRFVDGLPVQARPATFSYRALKFYGRNKVSVWAASLIVISLFAGFAAALSQARAARAQARIAADAQRQAELETERAKLEKQKAERTSRFMQSFLNYANPHWSGLREGNRDVTVREVLELVAARMSTELADAPDLRADIHYTIGEVYRTRDDHLAALRHFRQSLELNRLVHGEKHPKVARGIYYVCTVMDDAEGAGIEVVEPLLRQAIAMMRETDAENVNLPYMLQSLSAWMILRGDDSLSESRLAEAESMMLETRAKFVQHYGEHNGATISADGALANLAYRRGDFARAESMRESVAERYLRVEGENPNYIGALLYLAEVKLALGKRAEADSLFQQAMRLGRKQWGGADPRLKRLLTGIQDIRAGVAKWMTDQKNSGRLIPISTHYN